MRLLRKNISVWKSKEKYDRFPNWSALLVNLRRFISFPQVVYPPAPTNCPWVSEDAPITSFIILRGEALGPYRESTSFPGSSLFLDLGTRNEVDREFPSASANWKVVHCCLQRRSLLQKLHTYGRRKIASHPCHLSKSACCCLYFLSNVAFHKFKWKYQFSRFQYYWILWP